jgi:hypothetical protein
MTDDCASETERTFRYASLSSGLEIVRQARVIDHDAAARGTVAGSFGPRTVAA